jgi:hypothetical protein
MNVELAWYLTVDSLMPAMIVVVINESLDSAVERGPVFLWQNVNILAFYRFPKSLDPDLVFRQPFPSMMRLIKGLKTQLCLKM